MSTFSRRTFLSKTAATVAGGCVAFGARPAHAFPLDLPLGIQGNDLRSALGADLQGTLRALSEMGYQFMDWAIASGTYSQKLGAMPAKEVRQLFASFGLAAHNVHANYVDLHDSYDTTIQMVKDMGATSVVCRTAPGRTETVDDWKWHRDMLNTLGERTKRDGILTGFHNHPREFTDVAGVTPFDILLETDPSLVKMQFDVGACAVTGKDPVAYLTKYPDHYYSLHAKDVKDGKLGLAVGAGSLDWNKVFAAAKNVKLRHYVVENGAQGMEMIKASIEYLRAMKPV